MGGGWGGKVNTERNLSWRLSGRSAPGTLSLPRYLSASFLRVFKSDELTHMESHSCTKTPGVGGQPPPRTAKDLRSGVRGQRFRSLRASLDASKANAPLPGRVIAYAPCCGVQSFQPTGASTHAPVGLYSMACSGCPARLQDKPTKVNLV